MISVNSGCCALHFGGLFGEKTEEKEKRSSEERQKDDKYFQTIAAADPEKTREMSKMEALRTQVDNLQLEIQQL